MKTIFKVSRPARDGESRSSLDQQVQKTPAIDWNFQTSAPAFRGGVSYQRRGGLRLPAFRAISDGFFQAEAKREDRIEAAVFGLIATIAIWPMIQAAQALLALIK